MSPSRQNTALKGHDAALKILMSSSGHGTGLKFNMLPLVSKIRMPPYKVKNVAIRIQDDSFKTQDVVPIGQDEDLRGYDALKSQDAALRGQNTALRSQDGALRGRNAAFRRRMMPAVVSMLP